MMVIENIMIVVMTIDILSNTRLFLLRVMHIRSMDDQAGTVLDTIPREDPSTIIKVPRTTLAHLPPLPLFFPRPHRKTRGGENQERDQRGEEEPIEKVEECKRCWDF